MKKICMLIPGNPAIADYYKEWIKEIESKYTNISINYATSYVLFDQKLNDTECDQAMFKHYENIFLSLKTEDKITIIAHSVGSYFALRLLEKYPSRIEKIIIMFPYIGYSKSILLRFSSIPYLLDRFIPLAEIVSKCKNLFKKFDKEVLNITNDQLTACLRYGVRQCVYFNKYKFNTLNVANDKEKINFFYTKNDSWCPIEAIELLKRISDYKKVNLPHDFIITKDYREKMTKEISNCL